MVTEERFETLFRSHYGDVLAYATRRCPSRQDAEDLVAETFAVAWRRLSDVPSGEGARLWLFGTARGVRLNQERARHRQRSLARKLIDLHRMAPDFEINVVGPGGGRVLDALSTLSGADRELLQLHVWEGLTAEEIAVVLHITCPAVWKRLQRARERLLNALRTTLDNGSAQVRTVVPTLREEAP